jgi:hypothetical protein
MVLYRLSLNYLPIKAQQYTGHLFFFFFFLPSLSYYLSFHKGKEKKIKQQRFSGGICGCLIGASLVSSNNPENW